MTRFVLCYLLFAMTRTGPRAGTGSSLHRRRSDRDGSLHLPLTSETNGIVGKDFLRRAKKGVRIVNCARGELVDEEALAEAIRSGHVAGAALDVFTQEPPRNSPLVALPQVALNGDVASSPNFTPSTRNSTLVIEPTGRYAHAEAGIAVPSR